MKNNKYHIINAVFEFDNNLLLIPSTFIIIDAQSTVEVGRHELFVRPAGIGKTYYGQSSFAS